MVFLRPVGIYGHIQGMGCRFHTIQSGNDDDNRKPLVAYIYDLPGGYSGSVLSPGPYRGGGWLLLKQTANYRMYQYLRYRHLVGKYVRIRVHNFTEKGVIFSDFACPRNQEKGGGATEFANLKKG